MINVIKTKGIKFIIQFPLTEKGIIDFSNYFIVNNIEDYAIEVSNKLLLTNPNILVIEGILWEELAKKQKEQTGIIQKDINKVRKLCI